MKLLFDKNGQGSTELKSLMGYIDADLKFTNIKPDIITASNELINLIGREVYSIILARYAAADPEDADLKLLQESVIYSLRYPIAVNAYRLFAPSNDLSHTNNGRKMRSDDREKSAFEWQIDKDNTAQEKRYYRALDDLISLFDNLQLHVVPPTEEDEQPITLTLAQQFENELRNAWRNSDAYKRTHNLFVRTVSDFDSVFPIDSRLILMRLASGLEGCEENEILSRVGKTQFDILKTKVLTEASLSATEQKLMKLIKKACVFFAMAWAMRRFSVNLFPDGVVQNYTSDRATTKASKPALNIEPYAAETVFRSDCDRALLAIESLLAPVTDPAEVEDIRPGGCSDDKYFTT